MTEEDLKKLLKEAAEEGACLALERAGFNDPQDVQELKGILDIVRQTKKTVLQTATRIFTTAILGALFLGIAVKLKLFPGAEGSPD